MTNTSDRPRGWTRTDNDRVEDALRRGATRRDLLRMFAASGMAVAVAGPLALGASRAHAQTPQTGGAIRVAINATSTGDTLDPARAAQQADFLRLNMFYNKLVWLDHQLSPQMELAQSIDSDDAQTWTITLRPDIAFHNGKTLNADDVVFSLTRHKDPELGSQANVFAAQMSEITKIDDLAVRIVLDRPNADLRAILGLHHFSIIADGTTDFSTANGTGAFTCELFEPGIRSVARRNPDYWRQGGFVDSIELFGIPDTGARTNALMSGDVQIATTMDSASTRLLDTRGGMTVMMTPDSNYTNLNLRMSMDPASNADFVAGMKHIINRETIDKAVLRGFGAIHNDQPIQRSSHYFNDQIAAPAFDPDRAKHHFDRAGLGGTRIPIVASEAAKFSIDMASIIQADAANVGVNFDVQRVPSDGYWSAYWLKAPIHFGNINARPTPDTFFSLLYTSDAKWNESDYKSEAFDKLATEARATLDDARRAEIYGAMQGMVASEAATIIPAYLFSADAMTDKVQGITPHAMGMLQGFGFSETVWLQS